jgi:hypothetical protein
VENVTGQDIRILSRENNIEARSTTVSYCSTQPHCTNETIYMNLPYVADCTKYIYCELNGDESLRNCPPSQHFSPSELRCMDSTLANCPDCSVTTTTSTTDVVTTTEATTEYYCDTQEQCTNETVVLPYVDDCNKYIYCEVNGSESIKTCPPGEHFSPTMLNCMSPGLAQCPNCFEGSTISYCDYQLECSTEHPFTLLPYITDCTKYIYCLENGSSEIRKCPADQHFSPNFLLCMEQELANCSVCPGPSTVPYCSYQQVCEIAFDLLPYIDDCQMYIYCQADLSEELRRCADGKHFSPTLKNCELIEIANCPDCTSSTPASELTQGYRQL